MDYGYQLLRHVVQQVFGNIVPAARITLALYLSPLIGVLLLTGGIGVTSAMQSPEVVIGGGFILGILLIAIFAIIAYCWAAVGWHRYVLLEEMGNGFLPQWHKGLVSSYFGRAVVIMLILLGAMIAAGLVLGIIIGVTQSAALGAVLGVGLVFFASWLGTRVGLILPAAALGERMTVGESWAVTKPVSSQILLPLIVLAIGFGILAQLNVALFGQPIPGFEGLSQVDGFSGAQVPVTLSPLGVLVSGILYWFQLLMNLALMTTLYGNLVEGRQLN